MYNMEVVYSLVFLVRCVVFDGVIGDKNSLRTCTQQSEEAIVLILKNFRGY